jgi:argininosuccinate lyase
LNREAIAQRLDRGHLDATTLMEHLIRRGVPQRTAHGIVGGLVRKALDRGVRLADLPIEEIQAAHPDLGREVYDVLGVGQAVRAMQSYGSTAPGQVRRQIDRWKQHLDETSASEARGKAAPPPGENDHA